MGHRRTEKKKGGLEYGRWSGGMGWAGGVWGVAVGRVGGGLGCGLTVGTTCAACRATCPHRF